MWGWWAVVLQSRGEEEARVLWEEGQRGFGAARFYIQNVDGCGPRITWVNLKCWNLIQWWKEGRHIKEQMAQENYIVVEIEKIIP
jgi:hypothetical protein